MSDVKPLTRADLQYFVNLPPNKQFDYLSERGLIAPEPDSRQVAYQAFRDRLEPGCVGVDMEFTFNAGFDAGRELGLPERPLTREMVADCLNHAGLLSRMGKRSIDDLWFVLHAALTSPEIAKEGA